MIRKRPQYQHRTSGDSSPRQQQQQQQQQPHVALIIEEEEAEEPLYLRRAPPPRPPLFLPDKHYQAFLQGRYRRRSPSWFNGQKCAKGCTGFSLIAILFLVSLSSWYVVELHAPLALTPPLLVVCGHVGGSTTLIYQGHSTLQCKSIVYHKCTPHKTHGCVCTRRFFTSPANGRGLSTNALGECGVWLECVVANPSNRETATLLRYSRYYQHNTYFSCTQS